MRLRTRATLLPERQKYLKIQYNRELLNRRRDGRQVVSMGVRMSGAVRAARAAGLGADTQGVVNDRLDGARAATAFGTAAAAAVNLLGFGGRVSPAFTGTRDIALGR